METKDKEQVRPTTAPVGAKQAKWFEERKKNQIEELIAVDNLTHTLFSERASELYLSLNKIVRNYGALLAEHDPKFGDFSREEASQDLYVLTRMIESLEPSVLAELEYGTDNVFGVKTFDSEEELMEDLKINDLI